MATPNSLQVSNDELYENQTTVNSLEELKNFLAQKEVKKEIIEKIAVSFMAKIPAGTVVKLAENILHVGASALKLGENIFMKNEGTKQLVEQTKTRALKIMEHNFPAKQSDKKLAKVA